MEATRHGDELRQVKPGRLQASWPFTLTNGRLDAPSGIAPRIPRSRLPSRANTCNRVTTRLAYTAPPLEHSMPACSGPRGENKIGARNFAGIPCTSPSQHAASKPRCAHHLASPKTQPYPTKEALPGWASIPTAPHTAWGQEQRLPGHRCWCRNLSGDTEQSTVAASHLTWHPSPQRRANPNGFPSHDNATRRQVSGISHDRLGLT